MDGAEESLPAALHNKEDLIHICFALILKRVGCSSLHTYLSTSSCLLSRVAADRKCPRYALHVVNTVTSESGNLS